MSQPSPATLGNFTDQARANGNRNRWKRNKPRSRFCIVCGVAPRQGDTSYCRACRPNQHKGITTHYYARRKVNTDPHSAGAVLTADGLTTCRKCGAAVVRRTLWPSCPAAERHVCK